MIISIHHVKPWVYGLCISWLLWAEPVPVAAQPQRHIVWDKTPIRVTLPVGQEKLVHFPEPVVVDTLQAELDAGQLRLLNNDGTLYLTAHNPFPRTRLAVRLRSATATVLLDLVGKKQADTTPLTIVLPETAPEDTPAFTLPAHETEGYVKLLRFVFQQLYAPKRLLQHVPGIHRVPLNTPRTVRLLRRLPVVAMPLASWRGGPFFVTAVHVRNTSQRTITLTALHLVGQWQAVALYPEAQLAPHGESGDTTVVAVISKQPFAEQVGG